MHCSKPHSFGRKAKSDMHIPSEAPEVVEENRPAPNWPATGKVEIYDLQVNKTSN